MRNTWFISDTHFGHKSIIGHCRPQFSCVDEMEKVIIDNWNAAVNDNDLVYHLGDFAWTVKDAIRVRPQLNGTIRLIAGNHDEIVKLSKAGLFQKITLWRQFADYDFTASHIPMRLDQLRHSSINVHGHIHTRENNLTEKHINICVENTDYKPVHMGKLIKMVNEAAEK